MPNTSTAGFVRHADIHLAFAVDTPRGLLAPVVRDAHSLSIVQLAQAMKRLSDSAISGTIAPDDLSGGTFTVSNLGHLGIESFTPIINAPQVAILGVGALQPKPVRRDGLVDVRRCPRPVAHVRSPGCRWRAGRALPADSPQEDRAPGIGWSDAITTARILKHAEIDRH